MSVLGRDALLSGSINPRHVLADVRYKAEFRRQHPEYFDPEGLLIFCGPQGSGKTLSLVQYVRKVCREYPDCIVCSNIGFADGFLPATTTVVPYNGISSLTDLSNGYAGVLYALDEMHLEFNSLESAGIPMEVFTEISQQRKQRKHICGTSQVFMRLAKPFREQVRRVVLCRNFAGLMQYNVEIDGTTADEVDGKLVADVIGRYIWVHMPDLYGGYDTYQKIERMYSNAWKSGSRGGVLSPSGGYSYSPGSGRRK